MERAGLMAPCFFHVLSLFPSAGHPCPSFGRACAIFRTLQRSPTGAVDLLCCVRLYGPFAFPFDAKVGTASARPPVTSLLSIWTDAANCPESSNGQLFHFFPRSHFLLRKHTFQKSTLLRILLRQIPTAHRLSFWTSFWDRMGLRRVCK